MAILARASITLSTIRDVSSTIRYYKLQASTASPPAKPTVNPPGDNWVTTEPSYTENSTNSLYTTDLTIFTDGDFYYSDVSLSSSYEAAKAAYNKSVVALSQSVEYIVGTQAASTNAWTGVTTDAALVAGKTIAYKLPYAGTSTAATLNLTLSGGGTTGAKAVYTNTTAVTTHFGANAVINMTYDGTRWRANAIPNTNTFDRVQHNNRVLAAANISGSHLIVGNSSGYKQLNASGTVTFDLTYPILYATAAFSSGVYSTSTYEKYPGVKFSNETSIQGFAANKVVFLKGTVNKQIFTRASSNYLTCTVPTGADGYCYIPLGVLANDATSSNAIGYFSTSNQLYAYKAGLFGPVSIREAAAAAKTATNYLTDINNAGVFVHESNGSNITPTTPGANGVHISDDVDIIRNGEVVASYGEKVTLGKQAVAHSEFDDDSFTLFDEEHTVFAHLGGSNELARLYWIYTIDDSSDLDREHYDTCECYVFPMCSSSGIPIPFDRIDSMGTVTFKKWDHADEYQAYYIDTVLYENQDYTITSNPDGQAVLTLLTTPIVYRDILDWELYITAMPQGSPFYSMGVRRTGSSGGSLTGVGEYSVAEGYRCYAAGNYAHAEGYVNDSDGEGSHAEGYYCSAYTRGAHAEGYGTSAGLNVTNVDSYGSHAEGYMTVAHYNGGHAEGIKTYAEAPYAHAQNRYTNAYQKAQTTLGTFNAYEQYQYTTTHPSGDSEYGQYAVIIGNGTDENNRSNALTVSWDGSVETDGKITAGEVDAPNLKHTVQNVNANVSITTNNKIDQTPAIGASLTLEPGVYLLIGVGDFNTGATSGARNNQVGIYTGASPTNSTLILASRVRVNCATQAWSALQTTCVVMPTVTTKYTVGLTSNIASTSGNTSWLTAIPFHV